MGGELIYAFRVMRLPLLDAGGAEIGKIDDIVVVPGRTGQPPRVTGFVASSQRRRIFVNAARIAELDADGVRLRSWDIDLNPFKPRPGETLIGEQVVDRSIGGGERVSDIALVEKNDGRTVRWEVTKVRLASRNSLRRRPSYRLVDWSEVARLFAANTAMEAEAARLRDMHPSDVGHIVRTMPVAQRRQLAESMDDERLADVLEELPETEQLRLIEGLDLDRLIGVLEEMEYDDLADLLGEMPRQQRTAILEAMDEDDAEVVTRLLSYEESTAGGMMTPELVILGPGATVAEALAEIRDPDWTPSIASQIFVTQAPFKPPTGKHLGVVRSSARGRQRRRRRRPHARRRVAPPAPPPGSNGRGNGRLTVKRRNELSQPRRGGRFDLSYDPEAFGVFSESIARYLGTARFLVFQTVVIVLWLAFNILPPEQYQFDPWGRGLVLLTLVLSLQASYAAPLILLAQNRQERRDRVAADYDREVAERTQADTEFLAREIAGVRLALADVVTGEELRDQLDELTKSIERLGERLDAISPSTTDA